MAINTSTNKFRVITTTVSGLTTNSKFSDIKSPALVVNTSDGGIFYAVDDSSKLTQLTALPNHSHSDYLPKTGGTVTGELHVNTFHINKSNFSLENSGTFWIGVDTDDGQLFRTDKGWYNSYRILDSNNYTSYCSSLGHTHNQIVGNANSANAANALLMTGAGRPDTSPAGDTWIFVDSAGSMSAPWGFKHDQADNLIGFYGAGVRNAYIDLSNGQFRGSNFITSSDRRLKTNIHEIENSSKSLYLNFYEFDYKTGEHSAGHVAQEVKEVLPEFVHEDTTDESQMLSIDYTGLHSVQIKALLDRIIKLEEEIKILKSSK